MIPFLKLTLLGFVVVVNQDTGVAFGKYNINLGSLYVNDLVANHSATLTVIQNVTIDQGLDLVRQGGTPGEH